MVKLIPKGPGSVNKDALSQGCQKPPTGLVMNRRPLSRAGLKSSRAQGLGGLDESEGGGSKGFGS